MLSAVGQSSSLVINVMSKHTIGGDSIVGQAVIQLDKNKELYKGEKKVFKLPLQAFSSTDSPKVYDTTGTAVSLPNSPAPEKSIVSITVSIPSIYENMCGWFYDIHTEFNSFGFLDHAGSKMWVVLREKMLYCYDNPFDSVVKKTYDTHDVTDIIETEIDKLEIKMPGMIIKFNVKGVCSELTWAWGDDASKSKGLWRRALIRHHHAPTLAAPDAPAGGAAAEVVADK